MEHKAAKNSFTPDNFLTRGWLVLTLFFLSITSTHAQRENDAMFFGGCDNNQICLCIVPGQGNIYKFNEDSLEQIIDPACMPLSSFYSKATFCDKNTGDLIFASNGWRLINGDNQILTHKLYFNNSPHPGGPDTTGVNVASAPLFLPHPGDSTKAYLFYGQYGYFNYPQTNLYHDKFFTYALLDIPSKSLISKNNVLLSDTSSNGDIQACRHANGRDWWVIKPDIYSNKYFIGLLTPQGIQMNNITLPGVPANLRVNTSSKFTIQGNKYIQYNGGLSRMVHEYDFDRCTGTLSNFVLHDISDSIGPLDGSLASMSISPDGSKFYFARNVTPGLIQGFYQVDLATDSIRLIARYAGTPQMMPNGKKMIFYEYVFNTSTSTVTQRSISEISNPNESFQNLVIHHYKYTHTNANLGVAPSNFAYMRLGADSLSICDSLSVITKKNGNKRAETLVVFPNPATHFLQIEQQEQGNTQYKIINYYGQVILCWQSAEQKQYIDFSSKHLSNGLYILQAGNNSGRITQQKFVIQK
ncbi:MAG: T9SS type A sorting domain-containing protein [Bacteroidota bacterium]